ncbi:major capsid protein [Pleomorphomonas sp. JP5]|uniref:major capsid protein n=1 Tax=Pleomorphomonas sp. JP5 TaxID=2942998 RepID=UPI002042E7BD|nr:hypothetical protein [Pleomorphomonas sp. JP5]MCM5558485.1 hypothetical protein [Pleomorphomonas sp. JP5]
MNPITPTISAPITMAEYAQTMPQDSATRVFVENMVRVSDVMAATPILPAVQGKRAFTDISSVPTVGFRNFNSQGNESTGSFNLREEDTFPIDEYIKVDRALVARLGPDHRNKQRELKTIALGQYFSQVMIKGDNSATGAKQPNGLQVRCQSLNTNLLHNSVAAGGAPLSLASLDQLYWLVNKPTHWVFPRGLMPFLDIAARNSNLTGQSIAYDNDTDNLGRRIMRYKGLPILFGYEPDDTPDLLPFTEVGVGGGLAQTASIYCVSLRDGGLYVIEQTPLDVVDEGAVVGSPFLSDHISWDWGIAREHPRSVARLTSVTAATIVQ